MRTSNEELNSQTLAVQIAETKLKKVVIDGFFNMRPKRSIDEEARRIVVEALKSIRIKELRRAVERSLRSYYARITKQLREEMQGNLIVYLAFKSLTEKKNITVKNALGFPVYRTVSGARNYLVNHGYSTAKLYGVPLKQYAKDYTEDKVVPIIDRLAEEQALDPDDISGRNSLRNRAEMEVRYEANKQSIEELRAKGVRLVIVSTHADCSERCAPFQGKVFSLDGTSGTTSDGRSYRPIEEAVNIPYVTRAGVVYMNGLLGFNCRHYLIPFKEGLQPPKYSVATERREYEITKEQRAEERKIRALNVRRECYKSTELKYKFLTDRIKKETEEYKEYCISHGRAYYPNRLQVI